MSDAEASEADALEQARTADPRDEVTGGRRTPRIDFEVPEADAIEQSQEVPLDEDEIR